MAILWKLHFSYPATSNGFDPSEVLSSTLTRQGIVMCHGVLQTLSTTLLGLLPNQAWWQVRNFFHKAAHPQCNSCRRRTIWTSRYTLEVHMHHRSPSSSPHSMTLPATCKGTCHQCARASAVHPGDGSRNRCLPAGTLTIAAVRELRTAPLRRYNTRRIRHAVASRSVPRRQHGDPSACTATRRTAALSALTGGRGVVPNSPLLSPSSLGRIACSGWDAPPGSRAGPPASASDEQGTSWVLASTGAPRGSGGTLGDRSEPNGQKVPIAAATSARASIPADSRTSCNPPILAYKTVGVRFTCF